MPLNNPPDAWAAATRELTHISAEEIFDLPTFDDLYEVGSISSSGSADAFGSWVELVADVGVGKRLCYLSINPSGSVVNVQVQVGEGVFGSESPIEYINFGVRKEGQNQVIGTFLALSDNVRLSARAKDSTAGAISYTLGVMIA